MRPGGQRVSKRARRAREYGSRQGWPKLLAGDSSSVSRVHPWPKKTFMGAWIKRFHFKNFCSNDFQLCGRASSQVWIVSLERNNCACPWLLNSFIPILEGDTPQVCSLFPRRWAGLGSFGGLCKVGLDQGPGAFLVPVRSLQPCSHQVVNWESCLWLAFLESCWDTAMPICLYTIYGCLLDAVELSSGDTNTMAC